MLKELTLLLVTIYFVNSAIVKTTTKPPMPIYGGFSSINLKVKNNLAGAVAYANLYINSYLNAKGSKSPKYVLYKIYSAKQQIVAGANYEIGFTAREKDCVTKYPKNWLYMCGYQSCTVTFFVALSKNFPIWPAMNTALTSISKLYPPQCALAIA